MSRDSKSVRLSAEAYALLERRKRDDETFSETVERLARERPITDLAGLFTAEDVEEIRSARQESYNASAERRAREDEQ